MLHKVLLANFICYTFERKLLQAEMIMKRNFN
jgi:hypothetical protein